jgi:hypothetical protein
MTRRAEIRLSTKGLQSAARIGRNNFTFVIGSAHLPCDRFQAAYLSPVVANALLNDPTIDEFVIKNSDSDSDSDSRLLDLVRDLILGEAIIVEEAQLDMMKSLCKGLENAELNDQVIEFMTSGEELTLSNCISRLDLKSTFNLSITSETDFIASHFFEIPVDALQDLKSSELESILRNEKLCINNEDYLFDFLVEHRSDYLSLICYVQLEFLSPELIDRFFKTISYSDVDERLWFNICRRARHELFATRMRFHSIDSSRLVDCQIHHFLA